LDYKNSRKPPKPSSNPGASTNPTDGEPPPTTYHVVEFLGGLAAKTVAVVRSWAEWWWRGGVVLDWRGMAIEHQPSSKRPHLFLHNMSCTYNVSGTGGCWEAGRRRRGDGSGAWPMITGLGGRARSARRRMAVEHQPSIKHGASTNPTYDAPPHTTYHKLKVFGRLACQGTAAACRWAERCVCARQTG